MVNKLKLLILSTLWPQLIVIGDALSQLANAFIGGSANESLSGRAHRTKSKWEKVIDKLFWFDKDHCKVTHENDIKYSKWLLSRETGK